MLLRGSSLSHCLMQFSALHAEDRFVGLPIATDAFVNEVAAAAPALVDRRQPANSLRMAMHQFFGDTVPTSKGPIR